MAEADDSQPSGDRREDRLFLAVFAVGAVAVGAVSVFSVFHDRARLGDPVAFWEALVWDASSIAVILALAPAVLWLGRRAPPSRPPRWGWVAAHVAGALAFSLVHVLAMGAVRWGVYALAGDYYDPLSPVGDWPYELRKDVLIYAGLVALYTIWPAVRRRARVPAAAAVVEVRDGARRIFVSSGDIEWVEAAGNYVELHRPAGPVLHRASLAEMERRLAGAGFARIHRSRLVARDAVEAVESKPSGDFVVRLRSGRELGGSRRYRRAFLPAA